MTMIYTRRITAVAVLLALAVAAVAIGYRVYESPTVELPQVGIGPQAHKELMPSESPEWLEEHFSIPNTDGEKVRITYRNTGETGIRRFRHKQNLASETFWFADGTVRKDAEYALDGQQVVRGFEKRADGTLIWTVEPKGDSMTVRTTYWYDGHTPFSVELRAVGTDESDIVYFYKSGQKWLHTAGKPWQTPTELMAGLSEAQVWNNQGVLLYDLHTFPDTSKTSIYRDNGTLWYTQEFEVVPWYRLPNGGKPRRFTKVTVYSDDGTKVVRAMDVTGMGSGNIGKITDFKDDGSRIEFSLSPWANTFNFAEGFDNSGKSTGAIDPKTLQVTVDKNLAELWPVLDPKVEWAKQESDPTARSKDGSAVEAADLQTK
jgi:hypothetical protein